MPTTYDPLKDSFLATLTIDSAPACFSYFILEENTDNWQTKAGKVLTLGNGTYGITQKYTSTLYANSTEDMEVPFYFKRIKDGYYNIYSAATAGEYGKCLATYDYGGSIKAQANSPSLYQLKVVKTIEADVIYEVEIYCAGDRLSLFNRETHGTEWHARVDANYRKEGMPPLIVKGQNATFQIRIKEKNYAGLPTAK
ncbi:hypothetical protein [Pseudomonas putida]|uniref:hypothetical protein n=1 Tax=Pseudomonas putida TaxID=303 RepID=UPI00236642C5|nr:hypothetical protein [Pseudomonas putida]MDD2046708.1 hypothetical protein [Pseudomonas putida]